ncbi:dTDP-4-dehydrorhamnose reductase [Hyphococcus luteus]|uniref:dTDP-4-dehydrorhamnose reductase n=1 Tax=Hyphococcus luteus TaxID=2058213 RepID=A0A2S7K856_9PROT|nr:dTDP-4-dehydrorhamnose reductase [Marinicaulis flavus]PQA88672.1 dTDP-4-dehydrorhamnose reductase [Marinicaulis flavus]
MRMLVFGKNGQVARALQAAGGETVTALGRDKADLMHPGAAREAIAAHKPDLVINAAAYTAVDKAEEEEAAARRLNAGAPAEMAEAAQAAGVPFIHLSTDYVFDGKAEDRIAEDEETAPLNIYGATKREGEIAVGAAHGQAVILRTSWVFSEYGGNFVKTMLRLSESRDALSIVADQIGGPTEAGDIAKALLAIAGKKHRGAPGAGIYHFQGAPAVSWADFAEKIFDIAGRAVKVSHIKTEDYPTPAARPRYTVLDCAKIEREFGIGQPDWRESLRRVIDALNTEGQTS